MKTWEDFQERWVVDYEFLSNGGNPQVPICYVAKNIDSGKIITHWVSGTETTPLYPIDKHSVFIAYYASAEMGCHQSLGFKIPLYIVDLFAEFRCRTNGAKIPSGNSLIGACNYYGISSTDATYKDSMRDRILRGPPYNKREKHDILQYCQKDVEMTSTLFSRMQPNIDLPYALIRGRYTAAVAFMEYYGVPIDTGSLQDLYDCWEVIKEGLIRRVDQHYNIYEGTTFKILKFEEYLKKHQIPWDYTPNGLPKTDNNYMHEQAKIHPQLKPLQELRYTLGQLKLKDLQIGEDQRNRCLLSQFRTITSRNAPSSSKFIFGPATWLRHLIKPQKGQALSYIDYEQQELCIAAVLSGDRNLKAVYDSGDPYLTFAKKAGAIPPDGTKDAYPETREKYKKLMLGINYGLSVQSFARNTGVSLSEAKLMFKWHKQTFKKYWEWNSNFIDIGMLSGLVKTRFNWYFRTRQAKYRTLQNWPMQSNGADILRLAISICIDHGIKVIAPVHDAILIEAPISEIDAVTQKAQCYMEQASELVLNYKIRTNARIIKYPIRYTDPRGEVMWDCLWDIINNVKVAGKKSPQELDMEENYGRELLRRP